MITKKQLGIAGVEISSVCLGTMTWGQQNSDDEAFAQINYAIDKGINFIDTAELYSIPPCEETYGATEKILGQWINKNKLLREELVIATKIAGPNVAWIREAEKVTRSNVISAVDASLERLQTDYIDLYQIHWPDRPHPTFGKHWPGDTKYSPQDRENIIDGMLDALQGMQTCIDAGKIRAFGVSNESPWGMQQYLSLAKEHNLPRMVSVQNEFSLLHMKDNPYTFETCAYEDIAYLAWSPTGGGVLSGKYLNGARPDGARWGLLQRNGIFRDTQMVSDAITAYQQLALELGISTIQLALAWIHQTSGITSTIIGATSLAQLEENLDAFEFEVTPEINDQIMSIIKQYPVPF